MGKHLSDDFDERPRNRTSLGRAILLAIAFGAVAVVLGIFVESVIRHESPVAVLTQSVVPEPQAVFGKDRLLVLVVGKDYDYNEKDLEYSTSSRSDVIQVYSIDFVNHAINELSIPRDMDVVLPNGTENKINQALSDGGIAEAQTVIGKFLDLPSPPFDRYVILRINSTKELVNAIGGVDLKVSEQLDYDDNWGHLHIHFHPGNYHMNGEQAVSYARFRHDACGDPCRIKRQQQVLRAISAKLKNNKFADIANAGKLIDIVHRNVDTNFTNGELLSLAVAFQNFDTKTIKTSQVPYVDTKDTTYGGNVLIPDEAEKQKLVQNLLVAPPLASATPSAAELDAIAPSTIKVDVKNGTGVPGEAAKVAAALKTRGFVIGDVGNAVGDPVAHTEIHEHTTITFAGAKVRSSLLRALKRANVVADPVASPAPTSDVTVIVGKDLSLAQLTP